jgi:hypothetical protein
MLIVDPTAASGANGRVLEVFGLRNEDASSRGVDVSKPEATLRTTSMTSQAFGER